MLTVLLAATLMFPALPQTEFDDTEVVTNAPLPTLRADTREVAFHLALNATPSNNVYLVFGRDEDNDGALSRAEESLAVGWDCGDWKIMDCATGEEFSESGIAGQAELDWRLKITRCRQPRELEITANQVPLFPELAANVPNYVFDPSWNMAKIVGRGIDSPNPQIIASSDRNPTVIIIR